MNGRVYSGFMAMAGSHQSGSSGTDVTTRPPRQATLFDGGNKE